MKHCIFCGGSARGKGRAKEHILSQHLLQEFAIAKELLHHSRFRSVDGEFSGGHVSIFPTTRSLTYSGFVAGQVCAGCNNGWMNSLEIAVRPYLYPLMRGELSPCELSSGQREVLASWYLKTAIVLSHSVDAPQFVVPLDHARSLFQSSGGKIPADTALFGMWSERSAFRWSLGPTWTVSAEDGISKDDVIKLHSDTYKVFMQLGHLMLLACHWPHQNVEYLVGNSAIAPLGGLALDARPDEDCGHLFADDSERFMMAIGILLKAS